MFDEDPLTPAERELETALRSLRPAPARIDLTAARAAHLATANGRAADRRKLFWPMAAAAAALVAAGSAWLTLRWDPSPTKFNPPKGNFIAVQLQRQPPTLLVYRQALAQSPDVLNELLDRQAIAGNVSNRGVAPVGVVTVWSADLYSQLGEM